jgi:hypothetical protein
MNSIVDQCVFRERERDLSQFMTSNITEKLTADTHRAGEEQMTKAKGAHVEKFTDADLSGLREDLMKSGLDSWQAADLISSFLVARGYGVSTQDARKAAFRMESISCSLPCLQEELEKIAQVM